MKKFKSYTNKKMLIEHLKGQEENKNDEDNLISVYLTKEELNYIIINLKAQSLKKGLMK